jgi:hypothetical protein
MRHQGVGNNILMAKLKGRSLERAALRVKFLDSGDRVLVSFTARHGERTYRTLVKRSGRITQFLIQGVAYMSGGRAHHFRKAGWVGTQFGAVKVADRDVNKGVVFTLDFSFRDR